MSAASVDVGEERIAEIGFGLLVFLGVRRGDDGAAADRLARKILALRVFPGAERGATVSVAAAGGEVLCVSQFTLYGDTRRGNRPSYTDAAPPEEAEPLYERVADALDARRGRFGAHMAVRLVNDGPVTLLLEA